LQPFSSFIGARIKIFSVRGVRERERTNKKGHRFIYSNSSKLPIKDKLPMSEGRDLY
jgi:hypothetical protein